MCLETILIDKLWNVNTNNYKEKNTYLNKVNDNYLNNRNLNLYHNYDINNLNLNNYNSNKYENNNYSLRYKNTLSSFFNKSNNIMPANCMINTKSYLF